ncbi:MAG: diaminopimelate decarboxylase family protein [Promethearchaeota archaeon]
MKTRISGNQILTIRNERDLYVDGIKIQDLLNHYKTPFFIYSENKIRMNCKQFRNSLSQYFKNFRIYYSYKSNPFLEICQIIHSESIGAEVVSTIELNNALSLNLPSNEIIVGTPYLTKELLNLIFSNGIDEVGCWTLSQLENIISASKEKGKFPKITIRIKPNAYKKTLGFNITKNNVNEIITLLNNSEIKLKGLHSHLSTQLMDKKLYLSNLELILKACELFEKMGVKTIKEFNLGGGFPEASVLKADQMDEIFASLHDLLSERGFSNIKIVFEPGRYLVADAGMVLCKVIDSFMEFKEKWIRLNIGNNFLPRSSKANYKFFCVNKIDQKNAERINILGNLPSDTDFFTKNYLTVKNIVKDDIILVTNAGAYTQAWATRFPYPEPEHVLINKNKSIQSLN